MSGIELGLTGGVALGFALLLLAGLLGYAAWQILDFLGEQLILKDLHWGPTGETIGIGRMVVLYPGETFGSQPASQIRPTLLLPMSAAPDPVTGACGSGRQSFDDDGLDIPPFHGSRHSPRSEAMETAENPHAVRVRNA